MKTKGKSNHKMKPGAGAATGAGLLAGEVLAVLWGTNWKQWRRTRAGVEALVGILARLTQVARAQETETAKRAPTREEARELERRLKLL